MANFYKTALNIDSKDNHDVCTTTSTNRKNNEKKIITTDV